MELITTPLGRKIIFKKKNLKTSDDVEISGR